MASQREVWAESAPDRFCSAPERKSFLSPPLSQPYHLHSAAKYAAASDGNFLQKERTDRYLYLYNIFRWFIIKAETPPLRSSRRGGFITKKSGQN